MRDTPDLYFKEVTMEVDMVDYTCYLHRFVLS